MYDWEIQNYLKDRNYRLNSEEYINMYHSCPQMKYIKYNAFGNYFEMWTDCNYFKFTVYCKDNE